ncbi:MAG: VanZ family protein [Alphaproteobacteria bacterium]
MRATLVSLMPIAMGLCIAIASLSPPPAPGVQDKLLHFSAYGVWTVLIFATAPLGARLTGHLLVILLFSVIIEILQPFVGRTLSLRDVVANAAGLMIALPAGILVREALYSARKATAIVLVLLVAGPVLYGLVSRHVVPGMGLDTWKCFYFLTVGDNALGNRPWQGDVPCARLTTGSKALAPSGSADPVCGTPPPAGATHVIDLGSATPLGTPGPGNLLRTKETRAFCEAVRRNERFIIEAWMTPATLNQGGPARIVNFAGSDMVSNFMLGQERNEIVLRIRTLASGLYGSDIYVTSGEGSLSTEPVKVTAEYKNGASSLALSNGVTAGPVNLTPLFPTRIVRELSVSLLTGGGLVLLLAVWFAGQWVRDYRADRLAETRSTAG